jgi:hypothetical protein
VTFRDVVLRAFNLYCRKVNARNIYYLAGEIEGKMEKDFVSNSYPVKHFA